jgi:hypothetical protein
VSMSSRTAPTSASRLARDRYPAIPHIVRSQL